MSLENLLKIQQLQRHTTNPLEVQRLLAAASRNLADSQIATISDESRFDMAYKAIMQCAMVGLCANGYRPSTTMPGHHQTMIQSLGLTMGVPPEVWSVLDVLRRKRNLNDYGGNLIEPASVAECILQARNLLETTTAWLQAHHPEFLIEKP